MRKQRREKHIPILALIMFQLDHDQNHILLLRVCKLILKICLDSEKFYGSKNFWADETSLKNQLKFSYLVALSVDRLL